MEIFSRKNNDWEESKDLFFIALSLILFSNILPFRLHTAIFIIPYILFIFLFSIGIRTLALSLSLSFLLLFIQSFPWLEVKSTYLSSLNRIFDLNGAIGNFLEWNYDDRVSGFIKTVVFNGRSYANIYSSFNDLGLGHLISISGIHFLAIERLLGKFVGSRSIIISILLIYWSSINYTIPGLRAILGILFGGRNDFRKWSLSSIFSCPFNFFIYRTISFQLSFFISLILVMNRHLFPKGVGRKIINLVSAFLYSTLIFLALGKRIRVFAIVNLVLFNPLILFLFFYFLLLWPFSFLSPLHSLLVNSIDSSFRSLGLNRSYVYLDWWGIWHSSFSIFIFSLIFLFAWRRWLSSTVPKNWDYWRRKRRNLS